MLTTEFCTHHYKVNCNAFSKITDVVCCTTALGKLFHISIVSGKKEWRKAFVRVK